MAFANGINSLMVAKKQSAEGTKATASGAQVMRRITAEFATESDKFSSKEIKASQQQGDTRLANFRTAGTLNGEASSTTYEEFIAAMLRKDFAASVTTGVQITIAATTSGFTDSANAWISKGFKVGMIVRATGFVDTTNNAINYLVTAVTTNLLSCVAINGTAIGAETAGASVTVAVTGKRTYVPSSSHTTDWFTVAIEETDITVYRAFIDQQVAKMSVKIPAAGMSSIDFDFVGKSEEAPTGTAYFTSPTAQTATGNFSGATAILVVQGAASTVCTNMEFTIEAGTKTHPVVGSKYVTGLSRGRVTGSGSFTVFLEDDTYLEYYRGETEVSVAYAMAATEADASPAMSFAMPRIKITSSKVSDGEESKIVTCEYDMLEYTTASTQYEQTTLAVQDTEL